MDNPKSESIFNKWLKLLLKIAITILCLWYVSGKIDFDKAGEAIRNAHIHYLILAIIAFIISKLIAAIRLNIYFSNLGIRLGQGENIRLYWLGMFYNLFLPGSISGDAYKVITLTKKFDVPYRRTTAAVLFDRFSGLLGLGTILAGYSFFVLKNNIYSSALTLGALTAIALLYFITRRYFAYFLPGFISTFLLGILVQASQVIAIYLIMAALHIPASNTEYIFIFLVSSVVSVLPLTIGGLGIREVVFLEGSAYFGLREEVSVIISILFYLITLLVSAWGAFYMFRPPLKKRKDSGMSP